MYRRSGLLLTAYALKTPASRERQWERGPIRIAKTPVAFNSAFQTLVFLTSNPPGNLLSSPTNRQAHLLRPRPTRLALFGDLLSGVKVVFSPNQLHNTAGLWANVRLTPFKKNSQHCYVIM